MKNLLLAIFACAVPLLLRADPCPDDSIPPLIQSKGSVWDCTFDLFEDSDTNFISVFEESECGLRTVQIARWSLTKGGCGDDFIKRYIVTWYAEDMAGNISNLEQEITIGRPDLTEVEFPADTAIHCPDTGLDVLNGLDPPSIYGNELSEMCGFRVKSRIIDTIPGWVVGQCLPQITREWKVIENCTGMIRVDTQTISLIDTLRPIIACTSLEDTVTISLDPGTCTQTYTFPVVGAIDFCATDEELSYEHYLDGSRILNAAELAAGIYQASIVVRDPCNNADTCNFVIRVLDNIPPIVSCSLDTVVLQSMSQEINIADLGVTIEECGEADVVFRFSSQDPDMAASSQTFTCDMINTSVELIITATDTGGLSSGPTSCSIYVTASDGICNLVRANPEVVKHNRERVQKTTRAYFNGQELVLESQTGMSEIYIYNTSGQVLWKQSWHNARLEYQSYLPQSIQAGVYIVAIVLEDGEIENTKVAIF